MTATISVIVMNGPTPIMSIMFSDVAELRLSPRTSCGGALDGCWLSIGCMDRTSE